MPRLKTARADAAHGAMMGRARKGSIKARDASRRNAHAPARVIQRGRPSLCPGCNRSLLRFIDHKECAECKLKFPLSFRTRDYVRQLARETKLKKADILIAELP